jgi:hypothetical protein
LLYHVARGAFAVVYHAKERKGEGREVALKFVAKRHKRFSRTSLVSFQKMRRRCLIAA